MSEANTPNLPHYSLNEENSFLESDPIDELIASLEETTSSSENDEEEKKDESTQRTIQERNHQLLHRNAELQKALEETQRQLEQQEFRLRDAEELNAQHTDELNAAYEQNLSLSQELKDARQKNQSQEDRILYLTQQLQVSQQRVAQLERECALIQKQFQEQSYQLCQAEKDSRELSFRLQQQRHHTWQFKLALNKCLANQTKDGHLEGKHLKGTTSGPIPAWSSQHKTPSSDTTEESLFGKPSETTLEREENQEQVNFVEETLESIDFDISLPEFEKTLGSHTTEHQDENFPAPMISSRHHRKKRKTYASVELPKFNRN